MFGAFLAVKAQSRGDPWLSISGGQPVKPLCLDTIQKGEEKESKNDLLYLKGPLHI